MSCAGFTRRTARPVQKVGPADIATTPPESDLGTRHFFPVHPANGYSGLRPGIFQGITRVSNGTCGNRLNHGILAMPGETPVGLCSRRKGDKGYPDRRVCQWHLRPLAAYATGGRLLPSHWTPEPCLKKSCGASRIPAWSYVQVPIRRMNLFSSPQATASAFIADFVGVLWGALRGAMAGNRRHTKRRGDSWRSTRN